MFRLYSYVNFVAYPGGVMASHPSMHFGEGRDVARQTFIVDESAIDHEVPLGFAAYWRSLRHQGEVPLKRDFDPILGAPAIVPFIVLYDVVEDGADLRLRRMGEEVIDHYGRNLTGKTVREYTGQIAPTMLELYQEPIRRKEIVFYRGSYARVDRGFVAYQAAFAPLSSGVNKCDFLVGVVGYCAFEQAPDDLFYRP